MPRIRRLKTGRGNFTPSPYLHARQLHSRGEPLDNPFPFPSPNYDQFELGAQHALTHAPFNPPYPPGLYSSVKVKRPNQRTPLNE
jgi:hypothetical protein